MWAILVALNTQGMSVHAIDAAGSNNECPAYQAKFKEVPFVKGVSISDCTPQENDLLPAEDRFFINFRDSLPLSGCQTNVAKSDGGSGTLGVSLGIIKGKGFRDINFRIALHNHVVGWGLTKITKFGLGNECEATLIKWIHGGLHSVNAHVSTQLLLSCLICPFYKLTRCQIKKEGCEGQTNRKTSNYKGAKCSEKLVLRFNVADKPFPIVARFTICGSALSLLLGACVNFWFVARILFGRLGLLLSVMKLGAWL